MPRKTTSYLDHPVGGFFPLQTPALAKRSVFDLWQLDHRQLYLCNARSALALFLTERRARRIWLPAYVCESVAEGAAAGAASLDFYPVSDATLDPEVDFLDRRLRRGDYVLGVDYFGRTPTIRFKRLVRARQDVHWIEDRAQALDVGRGHWGHWQLFSPRKLLGVPDGGILAGAFMKRARSRAPFDPPRIELMLTAQAARLDDPGCRRSAHWFAAYRRSESMQTVTTAAMSALSVEILKACDAKALARRRSANWHLLHASLRDLAAFQGQPGSAPFGFAIRVRDAAGLHQRLVESGVFAQRHWARLPSPRARFSQAHRLAGELVTLPCDQRYGAREMHAIARTGRRCLR